MIEWTIDEQIDEELEAFIASESVGVIDAARMTYYGRSYRRFYTPVRTSPVPPDWQPRAMNPMHTAQEDACSIALVNKFETLHPEKKLGVRNQRNHP